MRKQKDNSLQPGLCTFQELPESYQSAFEQGTAHQLPGQFLPAGVDWFSQFFMLPFGLMYALPPLIIPFVLIQPPESYYRFFKTIRDQNLIENALMLGIFTLLGALLFYCALFAWGTFASFRRTWQESQFRKQKKNGFGIILQDTGLVARLIDDVVEGYNCLWLPKEAIADIAWQRMREEGAKHSRWIDRTRLCYVTEHRGKQEKYWITLKGHLIQTDDLKSYKEGDRFLFEQLHGWWQTSLD